MILRVVLQIFVLMASNDGAGLQGRDGVERLQPGL